MKARARPVATGLPAGSVSATRSLRLDDGWILCRTAPAPDGTPFVEPADESWTAAIVPGTVAAAIGPDDLDGHVDYDSWDWWYRCSVPRPAASGEAHATRLRFDGLATLAEVWFNGELVLTSANMFDAHEVDVTDLLRDSNELLVAFRSLESALSVRRPRPRWKTNLVEHQQLRWFRTTLLGRIPGWTPRIRPVGPWRSVWLETSQTFDLPELDLQSSLEPDGSGLVWIDAAVSNTGDADASVTEAHLHVGEASGPLTVEATAAGWRVRGSLRLEDPELWWPHTHGTPALHAVTLELGTTSGPLRVDCGRVGFRSIELDRTRGDVRLRVNGEEVFCRGACWTNNDIVSLTGDPARMREKLLATTEAYANMVRVGGTMVYESDDFYSECDRLGLMVWQDFMFANMDYPVEDEAFASTVDAEATQQLRRLGRHAAVVTFCGGSEVEQQAAMFGAPREAWSNDFFSTRLPELVESHSPGTPYWPSTPTEGVMPFHVGAGLTHYYGVGAYRRPLDDVRSANVRFTPECLGFSNLPEPDNIRRLDAAGGAVPHHPAWKRGVPRDASAGWDFEDIRDHYLHVLYGVDPVALRSEDTERYYRLSRVVTGRVMAAVFQEWRSPTSACGGGLVWFLNDLRPGAGWGILDSEGRPKPVWHFLRRAWAPRSIAILDRGLDGVRIEIHNEASQEMRGDLHVRLFGRTSSLLAEASRTLTVPARGYACADAEDLLGRFADPTYSYRFGPRPHAAIGAVFTSEDGSVRLSTVYWPSVSEELPPAAFRGVLGPDGSGKIESDRLAMDVRVDLKEWTPMVNYFDLLPGESMEFVSRPWAAEPAPPRGFVESTNEPEGSRLASGD